MAVTNGAGAATRRRRRLEVPFTVIGVAPESFTGMNAVVRSDFFMPLMMSPRVINDKRTGSLEARDVRNLRVKGRLRRASRRRRPRAN